MCCKYSERRRKLKLKANEYHHVKTTSVEGCGGRASRGKQPLSTATSTKRQIREIASDNMLVPLPLSPLCRLPFCGGDVTHRKHTRLQTTQNIFNCCLVSHRELYLVTLEPRTEHLDRFIGWTPHSTTQHYI